jgi:DNA-binding NarL/FixJ family response regulator
VQDKPILLVEDNRMTASRVTQSLALDGYRVLHAVNVRRAIELAKSNRDTLRFIIVDLGLPDHNPYTREETDGGHVAGIFLIREFAEIVPDARIYVKSQLRHPPEVNAVIKSIPSVEEFSYKGYDIDVIKHIASRLYSPGKPPAVLVVHGRDAHARDGLIAFIKNNLGLGEPSILRNVAEEGRIIIEKFEDWAREADLVFVLLTSDDYVEGRGRARQNVIFELGYFMGAFGRKSSKLIILKSGDVEMPTDIVGLWPIDVTGGFTGDAEKKIRNQLQGRWGIGTHPVTSPMRGPRNKTKKRSSSGRPSAVRAD